jgi:AraC-like DNA-binding protein
LIDRGFFIEMSAFHFSTDEHPEENRIAIWREVFGLKIARLDMEPPLDQPFHGEVSAKKLANLSIGSIESSPNRIARTRHLIADGSDDIMLGIMLKGEAVVMQEGQDEVKIGAGDAVVWSNSSVGESYYPTAIEFISVAIPRSTLVRRLIHPDRAMLSVIPSTSVPLKLLTGYLQLLLHETIPEELQTLSAVHVHDLVAMVLGANWDAQGVASRRGLRAARLVAVKADIERTLCHRNLTIEALALRHGISPRSLRNLFSLEATTFTDYVLKQRLARMHRLLSDPRFCERTISSLAFESGFGDLSYFNHSFRRRYGATPSDIRAAARLAADKFL